MLSYMHGLFKIAATIAESKIAITFVPSATTRELDISSCARAPTVLPQAIWRVESNWSEVLAAIHVSSDDSWELTCVTIFSEIVVGAATKGFDAICDGSARNSRGLDGAMDGQPKPKQLVLTTRSGGTSDVDTLSILDAPRANQLLEKEEVDEDDESYEVADEKAESLAETALAMPSFVDEADMVPPSPSEDASAPPPPSKNNKLVNADEE